MCVWWPVFWTIKTSSWTLSYQITVGQGFSYSARVNGGVHLFYLFKFLSTYNSSITCSSKCPVLSYLKKTASVKRMRGFSFFLTKVKELLSHKALGFFCSQGIKIYLFQSFCQGACMPTYYLNSSKESTVKIDNSKKDKSSEVVLISKN